MNNHLIFKYMDTFDIYKTNYINARLRYANAKDMRQHYREIIESLERKPAPEDQAFYDRYNQEHLEAESNVLNATDMLGDYIAKCAMARIEDDEFTCLITSGNIMNECAETYFEFDFSFMVMPTLERLIERNPVFNDICDQINFGKVDAHDVKQELEENGIECGEITIVSGYSEIDILRPPFDEVVEEIYDLAMAAIEGFRNVTK